jgi:hypothetical protein
MTASSENLPQMLRGFRLCERSRLSRVAGFCSDQGFVLMTTRQRLSPKDGFANCLDIRGERSVRDAQHAPYLVAAFLHELGQTDWIPRVFGFLRMYDGVARWMEDGMPEATVIAYLDLLQEVNRKRQRTMPAEDPAAMRFRLAAVLTNSAVTHFSARWKLERRFEDVPMEIVWNPLEQPWLAFLEQNIQLPDHARLHISRRGRYTQQLMAYLLER